MRVSKAFGVRAGSIWLVLAALGCSKDEPDAPPVAQLASLSGPVSLARKEASARPAQVEPLFAGDLLSTGEGARALLRAMDGRELELGERTTFRLGATLGRVTVELQEGVISVLPGVGGSAEPLPIDTPYGRTLLTPDAKAKLALEPKGLVVDLAMGSISVVDEDGGTHSAHAGQRMRFTVGAIEILDEAEGAPKKVELAMLGVELIPEAGTPRLRAKGARKYTAAAKGPQVLGEGTSFLLPKASRARLVTDGLAVRLRSEAVGTMNRATASDRGRELEVKLDKGAASVVFAGKGPTALKLLGAAASARVVSSQEAAVEVLHTSAGPRLEVIAGEVEVDSGGKTQRVRAGETASVGASAITVQAGARPLLVLPVEKRVRVYGLGPREVGLAVPGGPQRVQVATDAELSDLLASGQAGEWVTVTAPAVGALHWRVLDAAGAVAHTGSAQFLADRTASRDTGARSDTVAETGLKATVYFQSALPSLTFTFPAQEEAKGYRLKVFRASDLKVPVVERDSRENRCTVESGALSEGSYVWFASPLDEAGNETAGGRMNKMEILYDNSLTTLSITRPRPGERQSASAQAAGVAPLKSKLYVNGKPAPLDAQGRFEAPIGKVATVVFHLVAADGGESYWVRRLAR